MREELLSKKNLGVGDLGDSHPIQNTLKLEDLLSGKCALERKPTVWLNNLVFAEEIGM